METTATTLPPDMRYFPYNEMEYTELKSIAASITTNIPNDKMGWVWANYKRISKSSEGQPCGCGSAAGLWKKAMDTIREFIQSKDLING